MAVHYSPLKAERDAQRRAKAAERETIRRQQRAEGIQATLAGLLSRARALESGRDDPGHVPRTLVKPSRRKERERKRAKKDAQSKKVERANAVIVARDALTAELGRPPSLREIGRRIGITGERVRQLLNEAGEPTGDLSRFLTLTRARRITIEREQRERRRSIERTIIAARNVEIMEARQQGITYREIAEQHGLHMQTVQQIVGRMKRELAAVLVEAAE